MSLGLRHSKHLFYNTQNFIDMHVSQPPRVSFIIPTLNAAPILRRCLSAIRTQQYPQKNIEIIIADGGSADDTISIAKEFGAKIIKNPEVLHEPGKSRASKIAHGDIFFYIDADNILSHKEWLLCMVKPYIEVKGVVGLLPQTIPAPDSNPIDRYLGYLFTDPFTWFIYGDAANPKTYEKIFRPIKKTHDYQIFKFIGPDYPLFGLSQGVGTVSTFRRIGRAHADDIMAGMKLIDEDGLVAYVPHAGVYHCHVSGLGSFIAKYRWRIRNNISQTVKGMGIENRKKYFSQFRQLKMVLYIPYAFSIMLPFVDAIKLSIKNNDLVMLWHVPISFVLAFLIVSETIRMKLFPKTDPGIYGK